MNLIRRQQNISQYLQIHCKYVEHDSKRKPKVVKKSTAERVFHFLTSYSSNHRSPVNNAYTSTASQTRRRKIENTRRGDYRTGRSSWFQTASSALARSPDRSRHTLATDTSVLRPASTPWTASLRLTRSPTLAPTASTTRSASQSRSSCNRHFYSSHSLFSRLVIFTDRDSGEGNAISHVRPSVCFH